MFPAFPAYLALGALDDLVPARARPRAINHADDVPTTSRCHVPGADSGARGASGVVGLKCARGVGEVGWRPWRLDGVKVTFFSTGATQILRSGS